MANRNILIVDDEALARSRLKRLLVELKIDANVVEAANGHECLEAIKVKSPDVVLLDIQMPEISGFELLRLIEVRNFQIIFQTAFDDFALKAFDESACDYLLKPFSRDRLGKALDKAFRIHEQNAALQQLSKRLPYLKNLTFRKASQLHVLDLNEIFCLVSRDHYTCALTRKGEHIIDLSISHLEKQLDPVKFIRTHRNSIVAVDQVKAIGDTGDSTVFLKNGVQIPLSRANRKQVLGLFKLNLEQDFL